MLCRGAALRFMLTRLVDWLNVPPGALVKPQGPARIRPQAALPPQRRAAPPNTGCVHERRERVDDLHRRRLLGKSRPGRLGRDPVFKGTREGALRRRGADHQQPHGADAPRSRG